MEEKFENIPEETELEKEIDAELADAVKEADDAPETAPEIVAEDDFSNEIAIFERELDAEVEEAMKDYDNSVADSNKKQDEKGSPAAEPEETPLPAENSGNTQSRPAGLLRSAITAAVVLAVFAAVYFIFTAINGGKDSTPTQPTEPKAPVETTVTTNPETGDAETPDASDPAEPIAIPSDPSDSEKPAPTPTPDSAVTIDEEPSPEYTAATAVITADAKAKYGSDVMILPEYNSEMRTVKINGESHKCYLAAVVKMTSDSSSLPIIHSAIDVDSNTVWYDDTVTIEVID